MYQENILKRTGNRVWNCIKRILEQLVNRIFDYPNTAAGIILSLIIGGMLFMIPLVGPWLFIFVEPFLLIFFIVAFGSRDFGRRLISVTFLPSRILCASFMFFETSPKKADLC